MANKKVIPLSPEDIIVDLSRSPTLAGPEGNIDLTSLPKGEPIDYKKLMRQTAPFLRGGLVNLGRVGGATAGAPLGPAGMAGGALLGGSASDLAFQQAQRFSPDLFGEPPESIQSGITEAGFNTVIDAGAGGLINKISRGLSKTAIPGRLKYELLNKFFPQKPNYVAREALKADPNFPDLTVSQATGSEPADILTNVFTPQRKMQEIYSRQQNYLTAEATKLLEDISGGSYSRTTTPAEIARVGAGKAVNRFQQSTATKNNLYELAEKVEIPKIKTKAFVKDAKGNPIELEITGAVNPVKTFAKAQEIIADIDGFLKDPTNPIGANPKALESANKLKQTLMNFISLPVDSSGKPVMSYEAAKANKDILGKLLGNEEDAIMKSRYGGALEAIRNLLSRDIRDTANSTWPEGAKRAYNRAADYFTAHLRRYKPKLVDDLIKAGQDPALIEEKVLNTALSSSKEAQQWVKATGDRKEIGTQFFNNILNKAYDADGNFSASRALEDLAENDAISRTVLTSDQRGQLTNLLRKMQLVPEHTTKSLKAAVTIRRASATIGLAGATAASLVSGDLRQGLYTYGTMLLGFEMSKPIVQNLMLNPQNARMLARLVTLPPESTQAQNLIKNLLKGPLKGIQFSLQYADGTPAGTGQFMQDGRIHRIQ